MGSGFLSLRVRYLPVLIDTSLFSSFAPSFLLYKLLGGLHHLLIPVPSQLFLRTLGNVSRVPPLLLPKVHPSAWQLPYEQQKRVLQYLSIWFPIIQMLVLFCESFFCFVPYHRMYFAWHTEGEFAIILHNKEILIPFSVFDKRTLGHGLANWIAHRSPWSHP